MYENRYWQKWPGRESALSTCKRRIFVLDCVDQQAHSPCFIVKLARFMPPADDYPAILKTIAELTRLFAVGIELRKERGSQFSPTNRFV